MPTPRFTGPPGAPKQKFASGGKPRSEIAKKMGPQPPIPGKAPVKRKPTNKVFAKKGQPGPGDHPGLGH